MLTIGWCRRFRLIFVQDEALPQPDSSVERVIAQHLPGTSLAINRIHAHVENIGNAAALE